MTKKSKEKLEQWITRKSIKKYRQPKNITKSYKKSFSKILIGLDRAIYEAEFILKRCN